MQTYVESRGTGHAAMAAATTGGAEASGEPICPPFTISTPTDAASAACAFEACCRALSHKVNTALVEQLPQLQSGAVIDLTRNYIGAAGLQAIAVVLPLNPNVVELRAPRNGLSNDAVVIFCRAMRMHSRLAVLDFSFNTSISLAGGLALLSLAQQMPSLQVVHLDGTHVPSAVLCRLTRTLEMNAARAATDASRGALAVAASSSSRKLMELWSKSTSKRPTAATQKEERDRLLSSLEARVRAAVESGYQLPPAVPSTGWRVLEVPIIAPLFLFDTEIELLCTNVFPRINREFAPYQLLLSPVVVLGSHNGSTKDGVSDTSTRSGRGQPAPRTIGSYNRELHFLPVCDVTSAVARGRFAAIELVGDRPGDYAQVSAAAMLELQKEYAASSGHYSTIQLTEEEGKDGGGYSGGSAVLKVSHGALQPVVYAAHETALRTTQWLLVATRCETRAMQLPAALSPLLTADPSVSHPDRHRNIVRDIVYDSALVTAEPANERKSQGGVPPSELTNIPRTLEWDYTAEEYQWKRHLAWCRHVVASAPVKELVLSQYTATFDCTDAAGGVRLKGLEAFEEDMYQRLRTLVQACLSSRRSFPGRDGEVRMNAATTTPPGHDVHNIFHHMSLRSMWDSTFFQAAAELSSGAIKKNVMNRVVLYAANPPSRNALLLHSHDVTGLAMFMCRAASRLLGLQHAYTLALFSARSSVLLEEPTDVRSFVVHIVSQLTTDAAVLSYVHAEVDMERLCAFLMQILSGMVRTTAKNSAARAIGAFVPNTGAELAAAGLPSYVAQFVLGSKAPTMEGGGSSKLGGSSMNGGAVAAAAHAFVIVADGIDKLVPPVRPCGALVYTTDGDRSAGSRAELANWSDDSNANASAGMAAFHNTKSGNTSTGETNPLGVLLPRALARNVRFIASCTTDSAAFNALRRLGHDSVEALSLGPVSSNEVEQYLSPAILSRFGLKFSEDDFECARAKKDAAMGEYMHYLQDAARAAHEAPGFLTQSQVIQAFPATAPEAAQGVYDRLVHAFGLPITRAVLGFLMASRWGLTIPELRTLLPQLTTCRLQELLRLLRPVLEPESPKEASAIMGFASGNAQLGTVRLFVQSFLDVVHRETLQSVKDEQQLENDQRVWHTQLAQYYLSIVYKCLNMRKGDRTGVRRSVHGDDAVATTTADDSRSSKAFLAEQRRAIKEVIYHMTQSGAFWPQLDVTILSLPFLQLVYDLGLGYAYLRDLTAAFNERYQRHLLGEDIGEASWQHTQDQMDESTSLPATSTPTREPASTGANSDCPRYALPAVLSRMRDYVRFAHDNGLLLSLRPSLVTQMALQVPACALNSVQRDAVMFLYRQLLQQPQPENGSSNTPQRQDELSLQRFLYFTLCTNASTSCKNAAAHLGPVTCAAYLPNSKFIVTASRDRSLAWVNPQTGTVTWHARQPTSPVESLTVCRTSAYVAAVSEDCTVWIYDGLRGKLVTQCRGVEWFDAPISSIVFSARGRYLWVVTADACARCFECETGRLQCVLRVPELMLDVPKKRSSGAEEEEVCDDLAEGEPHDEAVVRPRAAEWRHRQHHLSVLPDPIEDVVCTTVVGREVRQWQLYPWKSASPGDVKATPEVEEKAKDSLVAFDMIARCRLVLAGDSSAEVETSSGRPEGYKQMVSWEPPATSQLDGWRHAVYALALSIANKAEVHLLALPLEAVNGKAVAAAVRCACASSTMEGGEVAVMCASTDSKWLAVGMTSGKICLFDLKKAYCTWAEAFLSDNGVSSSTSSIWCEPTCVYTGLMPVPGMVSAPIRALAFHRDGRFLFALGGSLKCWRVPLETPTQDDVVTQETGEYIWAQSLTCLTVMPPPVSPSSDAELPSSIAEVCVGDETGRLTLLRLWKPNF